jgi:hypothetical protein
MTGSRRRRTTVSGRSSSRCVPRRRPPWSRWYPRPHRGRLHAGQGPIYRQRVGNYFLDAHGNRPALIETNTFAARSGFLYSLDALTVLDLVPTEVLELVTSGLSRENLETYELDFYDALVAKLDEHRRRPSSA